MIYLACRGITIVVARLVFVAGIYLLPMNIGVEVAAMLCVTVSETCGGKSLAVVVYDHGAKAYLITSVPVDIGNAEVMISLSLPRSIGIVEPSPALLQRVCSRVNIVCYHLVTCVYTTCKEDAWFLAVEIRSTEEVLA